MVKNRVFLTPGHLYISWVDKKVSAEAQKSSPMPTGKQNREGLAWKGKALVRRESCFHRLCCLF